MLLGESSEEYNQTLSRGLKSISEHLEQVRKPFSGIEPRLLKQSLESIDLDAPLSHLDEVLAEVREFYLNHAVYFHHPKYMAHMNCPVALPAVIAELITASVNSSMDTWDQAGGAALIEQRLVEWTAAKLGFAGGADGVFTTGGTQSNLMALLLARDHYCAERLQHEVKEDGLPAEHGRLRVFASEVSHVSLSKAASILGLGRKAVVKVACDSRFRMDAGALERELEASRARGELPIAVVATAGTTDFGSIDPLSTIAEICLRERLWMHTDATYGCGLLVSTRHRSSLEGVEHSDSVAIDYHKSFLQPVSCSALLVKERQRLDVLTHYADYLNPEGGDQEALDSVNKSLQTTRRFDALKLWMTLRMLGPQAIGKAFETVMELAKVAHRLLTVEPNIEILHEPELSTLVFRYAPSGTEPETLDRINAEIRTAMYRDGEALIGSTKHQGRVYLKLTLLNPATRPDDIKEVLETIKRYGNSCVGQTF